MAKTLLIPTDFRVESLNTLKFALAEQNEPVKVLLLYGYYLSDSITDLLFYSPAKTVTELTDPSFSEALNIIRNRFGNLITELKIELLHNRNKDLLNNMIDAQQIDTVYVPKSYELKPGTKGFDVSPLLRKAKVQLREIEWNSNNIFNADDQLQVLFVPLNNTGN